MKHICGQCTKGFRSEEGYLEHVCEVLGRKPGESEVKEAPKDEPKSEE